MIKYYWLSIKIFILKQLVKIEKVYDDYKQIKLKAFVNSYIIAESGYNPKVIMELLK